MGEAWSIISLWFMSYNAGVVDGAIQHSIGCHINAELSAP